MPRVGIRSTRAWSKPLRNHGLQQRQCGSTRRLQLYGGETDVRIEDERQTDTPGISTSKWPPRITRTHERH